MRNGIGATEIRFYVETDLLASVSLKAKEKIWLGEEQGIEKLPLSPQRLLWLHLVGSLKDAPGR